ncbi:DUF6701 domain-containing protein [Ferrimonas pelagia]|uniref:DUF6701 domain-containing protein n=1 Tax=Ferrimonas pelagia TaxID=1177826 RepID=UPI0031E64A14
MPTFRVPAVDAPDLQLATGQLTLSDADGFSFGEITVGDAQIDLVGTGTYYIDRLILDLNGTVALGAGRYWIDEITLNHQASIQINGDVQLFVRQMTLGSTSFVNATGVAVGGDPEQLDLWIYEDLGLGNGSTLAGHVYAQQNVNLGASSYVLGALSAGGEIRFGNGSELDGSARCGVTPEPPSDSYFRVGQVDLSSGQTRLNFTGYSGDVAPIVVVTPSFNGSLSSNGPGSVQVEVFDDHALLTVAIPPKRNNNVDDPNPMISVPYLIASPGHHVLNDVEGNPVVTLQAGTVVTDRYQGRRTSGGNPGYESFNYLAPFNTTPAVLTQRLTDNNNSFLTTFPTEAGVSGAKMTLEFSELTVSNPVAETVGWIAVTGGGEVVINDEVLRFQSGVTQNHVDNGARSLSQQCEYFRSYGLDPETGEDFEFELPPMLLMNKTLRRGNNGGWARSCVVETNRFSVGIDEDQANDNERNHVYETVSFVVIGEPAATTNFFQIQHDGEGITCLGEPVTLLACKDRSCNRLMTEPVTVQLTPSSGWAGGAEDSVTFTGSVTLDLWSSNTVTPTQVWIDPQTSGLVSCLVNNIEVSQSACAIQYASSGLVLEGGLPTCQRPQESLSVRAVQSDPSNPDQCIDLGGSTRTVDFGLSAIAPADPAGEPIFELERLELRHGQSQQLDVQFDADGIAELNYEYSDAGQIEVTASTTLQQGGEVIELSGRTHLMVAPAGFHITAYRTNNNRSGACTAADASCDAFAQAGENIDLEMRAVCWDSDNDTEFSDNPLANNFEHSGIGVLPKLLLPSPGTESSTGSTSFAFSTADNGVVEQRLSVSEVGIFQWQLPTGTVSYLGRQIDGYSSDPIGRFTPSYLSVADNAPLLQPFCGEFSYLEQPLGFAAGLDPTLTVQGHAQGNWITNNYIGDFWRLDNSSLPRSYSDDQGSVAETSDGAGQVIADVDARSLQLADVQLQYSRQPTPTSRFEADLSLMFASGGLTDRDGICVKSTWTDRSCLGYEIAEVTGTALLDGRLKLTSVYGTETQSLNVPVEAQYFNGSHYSRNLLDSCTVVAAEQLSLDPVLAATGAGSLVGGVGQFAVSPLGHSGEVDAEQALEAMPWLRWYWGRTDCGATDPLCDPQATLTFGRFRGHDKVIYRREILTR